MIFGEIPLFADLDQPDHDQLLRVAMRRRYPRHTMLVQEGDPGERFFLLRNGRAKVFLGDASGREVILAILGPGDFFGEMALVDDLPCSANVMSLEESEFLTIGKSEFQRLMLSSPAIAVSLLKALSRRIREADQQIESLALHDVRERIQQALHTLAEREGEELVIPARVTHKDIAAMVGTAREVVTRVFRDLEDRGMVRVHGRRITLPSATATRQ